MLDSGTDAIIVPRTQSMTGETAERRVPSSLKAHGPPSSTHRYADETQDCVLPFLQQ